MLRTPRGFQILFQLSHSLPEPFDLVLQALILFQRSVQFLLPDQLHDALLFRPGSTGRLHPFQRNRFCGFCPAPLSKPMFMRLSMR